MVWKFYALQFGVAVLVGALSMAGSQGHPLTAVWACHFAAEITAFAGLIVYSFQLPAARPNLWTGVLLAYGAELGWTLFDLATPRHPVPPLIVVLSVLIILVLSGPALIPLFRMSRFASRSGAPA